MALNRRPEHVRKSSGYFAACRIQSPKPGFSELMVSVPGGRKPRAFITVPSLQPTGALALIQLQEDMEKKPSAERKYTEEELEEYMNSHKKRMIDSIWKLNMADIKATLSRVLQDPTVKKEELRARAKGLRTLGRIFQKAKSASETESEPILHFGVHNLNGVDQDHSSRGVEPKQSSQTTMAPQVNGWFQPLTSGNIIELTLWDEMATNFDKEALELLEKPVIIVISFCRVSKYRNVQLQLSATSVTHCYLNPHIQEAKECRAGFKGCLAMAAATISCDAK
ncbi:chaperone protein DnaJ 10 [Tanacetum coccineum]